MENRSRPLDQSIELNSVLPTPRGAYSIARLRSGKIGLSNISRGGTSIARKSLKPMDLERLQVADRAMTRAITWSCPQNRFQNRAMLSSNMDLLGELLRKTRRDTTRQRSHLLLRL